MLSWGHRHELITINFSVRSSTYQHQQNYIETVDSDDSNYHPSPASLICTSHAPGIFCAIIKELAAEQQYLQYLLQPKSVMNGYVPAN